MEESRDNDEGACRTKANYLSTIESSRYVKPRAQVEIVDQS